MNSVWQIRLPLIFGLLFWGSGLTVVHAQHDHELQANGGFYITNGAVVTVLGDVHIATGSGQLINEGELLVAGNLYKTGDGRHRSNDGDLIFNNELVNQNEPQFILGEFTGLNAVNILKVNNQGAGLLYLADGSLEVKKNLIFENGRLRTGPQGLLDGDLYPFELYLSTPNEMAIQGHDTQNSNTKYVEGRLRREITAGSYFFPIGIAPREADGIEPFQIDFTNAIPSQLEVTFRSTNTTVLGLQHDCDLIDENVNDTNLNQFDPSQQINCVPDGQWQVNSSLTGLDDYLYGIEFFPSATTLGECDFFAQYIGLDGELKGGCQMNGFTVSGLKRFGSFDLPGIVTNNVNLPVELVNFKGRLEDQEIVLIWETASEVNLSGYEVQKSTDAISFQRIGWEQAQNGDSFNFYEWVDSDIQDRQIYYYRLKMEDTDGSFEYSPVVSIVVGDAINSEPARFQPNPVSLFDPVVSLIGLQDGPLQIRVFSNIGQQVYETEINAVEGVNQVRILPTDASPGIYWIHLQDDVYTRRGKLLAIQ